MSLTSGSDAARTCYFYIDIAVHPDPENVRFALEELRKACGFFKIQGTYPVDVH